MNSVVQSPIQCIIKFGVIDVQKAYSMVAWLQEWTLLDWTGATYLSHEY